MTPRKPKGKKVRTKRMWAIFLGKQIDEVYLTRGEAEIKQCAYFGPTIVRPVTVSWKE